MDRADDNTSRRQGFDLRVVEKPPMARLSRVGRHHAARTPIDGPNRAGGFRAQNGPQSAGGQKHRRSARIQDDIAHHGPDDKKRQSDGGVNEV